MTFTQFLSLAIAMSECGCATVIGDLRPDPVHRNVDAYAETDVGNDVQEDAAPDTEHGRDSNSDNPGQEHSDRRDVSEPSIQLVLSSSSYEFTDWRASKAYHKGGGYIPDRESQWQIPQYPDDDGIGDTESNRGAQR